jgi:hypothetical protein
MEPSSLSHHQVQVEMVLGSEGKLGLASLSIGGRASTPHRARDRARRPANQDEDPAIVKEKTSV